MGRGYLILVQRGGYSWGYGSAQSRVCIKTLLTDCRKSLKIEMIPGTLFEHKYVHVMFRGRALNIIMIGLLFPGRVLNIIMFLCTSPGPWGIDFCFICCFVYWFSILSKQPFTAARVPEFLLCSLVFLRCPIVPLVSD